jgi:hypothetical protein
VFLTLTTAITFLPGITPKLIREFVYQFSEKALVPK